MHTHIYIYTYVHIHMTIDVIVDMIMGTAYGISPAIDSVTIKGCSNYDGRGTSF